MAARALEVVGERWTLLVVRELLLGPQRFTDLLRGLPDITPTRLTNRLRQLEADAVVMRRPPTTGREVWYELTDAGRDLEPVLDALTLWGIDHAFEPLEAGQPVSPAPVMTGTKMFLSSRAGRLSRPVVWTWRFPGNADYAIRHDEDGWSLAPGEVDGSDVVVETTLEAWAQFLTARGARTLPRRDILLSGTPTAIEQFAQAFASELRST
jgi:DNA-binding HxlR family transcriptional regulator